MNSSGWWLRPIAASTARTTWRLLLSSKPSSRYEANLIANFPAGRSIVSAVVHVSQLVMGSSHVPAADVCLGRDLSWDESRVLHSDGRDGEGGQRPESGVQIEERQHAGLLQAQHHLLSSRRPRDVAQVRSADFFCYFTSYVYYKWPVVIFVNTAAHALNSKSIFSPFYHLLRGPAARCASAWSWILTTNSVSAITSRSRSSTSRSRLQRNSSRRRGACWGPVLDQRNDSWLWYFGSWSQNPLKPKLTCVPLFL